MPPSARRRVVGTAVLAVALALVVVAVVRLTTQDPAENNPALDRGIGLCANEKVKAPGLRVEGRHFVSGGATWYPRGLNIERFATNSELARDDSAAIAASLKRWDKRECTLMRDYGANAVRIQVGQPTIDPESPLHDAGYAAMIDRRVREALDSGFVVIMSLQWQKPDDARKQPRPDRNSQQIWQDLAETWGDDTRVVFELYNEPNGPATAQNWQVWLRGGNYSDNPSGKTVGMQALIDTVRGAGAENVLLLPGLMLSKSLQGVPVDQVVDPMNNFGFAFHTPNLKDGESGLEARIGYLADRYPLWATEQVGASPWSKCYEQMDEDYAWYFPWLAKRGVGVTSPWDRRSVWGDAYGRELTSMEGFSCRPTREGIAGPGELFRELFLNGYPR